MSRLWFGCGLAVAPLFFIPLWFGYGLAVAPLSFIPLTVLVIVRPKAVHLPELPVAFVAIAVAELELSLALLFSFVPVAVVERSISVFHSTHALTPVVSPVT